MYQKRFFDPSAKPSSTFWNEVRVTYEHGLSLPFGNEEEERILHSILLIDNYGRGG